MENLFECPICKNTEFENLDYFRLKPEKFCLCKKCGFVTYAVTEQELVDMYVKSDFNPGRKFSGSVDDMTKANKTPYHHKMIGDFLKSKKNMAILDYGCSTGYVLNICKEYGHTDVTGIELNPAHAEYGRREYGIDIHEVFDIKELNKKTNGKKYDFIINFAVLEHLHNPVEKLKQMRDALNEGGIIYCMTPIWFKSLYTSQFNLQPFEALFVPEHINCFSETSRNNVFKLAGMKVVKRCDTMYGDMVLLEKCEPSEDIVFENAKKIQEMISNTKKAIELMFSQRYEESLAVFPNNPEAYFALALSSYKTDFKRGEDLLKKAIEVLPNYAGAYEQLATFYFQQNKLENAIEYYTKAIEMNPTLYHAYYSMAEIFHMKKDYEKSNVYLKQLFNINPNIKSHKFNQDALTCRDLYGLNIAHLAKSKKK